MAKLCLLSSTQSTRLACPVVDNCYCLPPPPPSPCILSKMTTEAGLANVSSIFTLFALFGPSGLLKCMPYCLTDLTRRSVNTKETCPDPPSHVSYSRPVVHTDLVVNYLTSTRCLTWVYNTRHLALSALRKEIKQNHGLIPVLNRDDPGHC